MTFRKGLKVITCVLLLLLFCIVKRADSLNNAECSAPLRQPDDLESLKVELSRYRTWTMVNPQPVLMDPVTATACAALSTGTPSPHSSKYILVYVNDVGRTAMMSEQHPKFPLGSIIVKEKLKDGTSRIPELLTVMVKRGEGYDPGNGNWDYLTVEGDSAKIERPANVKSCQTCHLAHKATDYVSRVYLPQDIREKLK